MRTFAIPSKRDRYAEKVSERHRAEFLGELYHFDDFDPRFVVPLEGGSDSVEGLLAELERRGAGDTCHLISVDRSLDGRTAPLREAIAEVYASAAGTIVCCVPGRLAYFEGEGRKHRFILDRG